VASDDPSADLPAGDSAVSWREQAVARSLVPARMRAEDRVQRFLDAAFELVEQGASGKEFTVQEVVERSGQSLRSFYLYFGGKHELLLAMFEESVRATTEHLARGVAQEDGALERLHRFVVEYYRCCRPAKRSPSRKGPAAPVMVDFAQQLLTGHPAEAASAFAPLVALFGEVLDDAVECGAVRAGLRSGPIAGIVLEAIMFNHFSSVIGGASPPDEGEDPAEQLWDLILHGISSTRP
jgi:AcrR family transcriptional regulator